MQNSILVGILSNLLAKPKVTSAELAKKYEISPRTVMRYIDAINESGVPIVTYRGRSGGYGIIDKYKITASFLTKEEYERILSALDALPPDKVISSITDKLKGLQSTQSARLTESDKVVIDTEFSPAFKNKFNILQQSIKENVLTQISYVDKFGESTNRRIEPLTFIFKEGFWYIYAYCNTRKDFRFFKINRISGITPLLQHFQPRPYVLDSTVIDKFIEKTEHIEMTISFDNDALVDVQDWLGEESVIKKGAGYLAFAKVPYDQYLLTKLLTFGDKIKVLKPAKLSTSLVKLLHNLLKHYTSP